ncbi:hypothetical protein FA15DRAFT_247679 [Coprinopsis marcescibilis]|uniref:Uncharacterized protein n=1 Tax=Coprinopsis marcescibilis TaxID=230819 RepID=A0A5C3KFB1_COPMA|nr:hypothetical protein FA15DRAFT_247679 [Coprinopsis marcescibilis]
MARLSTCFAVLLSALVAVQASPILIKDQHQNVDLGQHQKVDLGQHQKVDFQIDPICQSFAIQIFSQLQNCDRELQLIQHQFGRNARLNRVVENVKGGLFDARRGIDEFNLGIKDQLIIEKLSLGRKDLALGLNRAKDGFKQLRTNHRGVNRRVNRAKVNLRDSLLVANQLLEKCGAIEREVRQPLIWDVPSLTLTGSEPEETGKDVEILESVGSGVIAEPTADFTLPGEPLQTGAPSEIFDINTCPPPVTVTVTAGAAEITDSVSLEVTPTASAEESLITDSVVIESESVTESVGEGATAVESESVTESVSESATATEFNEGPVPTAAALVGGADSYRDVGPN